MTLRPWAFTKLNAFETCPRKASAQYISRETPYESTPEREWGNYVHDSISEYIRSGTRLPGDLGFLERHVPVLGPQTRELRSEAQLAMDVNGISVPYGSRDCYFRGKLDVLNIDQTDMGTVGYVFDWKTGKLWDDHDELECHAALASLAYPEVVQWFGCYVQIPKPTKMVPEPNVRLGELHTLKAEWHKIYNRVHKVEMDLKEGYGDTPRPNALCGWCSLRHCQFWKERKK